MTEDELCNASHLLAVDFYGNAPTIIVNGYYPFVYIDVDFKRVYVGSDPKEDNVSKKAAHLPRYPQR